MANRLSTYALLANMMLGSAIVAAPAEAGSFDRVWYYTKVFPNEIRPANVSLGLLDRVNKSVNKSIRYKNDAPRKDRWSYNPARGDCDDYAITKMGKLVLSGVPISAMRLARGMHKGQRHMVLLVYTPDGKQWVLDNTSKTLYTNKGRFTAVTSRD